ncbi:MAG: hypothetical protein IIU41_03550, partial [Oscillospiraceae bacterium]|nr:hypothetical protein [Oscillospiraceae bacterium]
GAAARDLTEKPYTGKYIDRTCAAAFFSHSGSLLVMNHETDDLRYLSDIFYRQYGGASRLKIEGSKLFLCLVDLFRTGMYNTQEILYITVICA